MADHAQNDHVHGSMDIREHEKTYAGFIKFTVWGVVVSLAALIFLALSNS